MNLDDLHLFLDVAERGGFAAVAKAHDLDPSNVSRRIAGLEQTLGFRLFERSTRRIALTEAGTAYRDRIAPLVGELSVAGEAARDMVSAAKGTLRVSASTAFGQMVIVPMLAAYQATCPDVTVRLLLSDRRVSLIEDRIDLAVRLGPGASGDAIVSRLAQTRYRVLATPEYWRANPVRTPSDLARLNCLLFPYDGFRDLWRFRGPEGETEVPVKGNVEISAALALRAAALAGMGPALLTDWLVGDDLAAGRLIDGFPDHQATATDFDTGAWLLYPSRAYLPLKTRVFIDMLRKHVGSPTTS